MSESLSPELEALAARIRSRSADALLAMARRLVATPTRPSSARPNCVSSA